MKVRFANTDVEVWKLRRGTALMQNSNLVHLISVDINLDETLVQVQFHNNYYGMYRPYQLEWLEPH